MQMECMLQCSANCVPLTPINFLERAAHVYGDKTSIVYGTTVRFSWRETYERCLKLASALLNLQISQGDIVAALAPNVPALYELHFAVPMAGLVLSALNTRLDAAMVASILQQLEAKIMFVDYQFVELVLKAFNILSQTSVKPPLLVVIPEFDVEAADSLMVNNPPPGSLDYNDVLKMGKSDHFEMIQPENECAPISVNFTSGSTGHPKGVVYSHRAAYLNSLAQISRCGMGEMPVFLWTVDMFRCNGWCCTWALAALGGTNICLRTVSAKIIFDSIFLCNVTHFCGAPALLNIISNASTSEKKPLQNKVYVVIAGALPTVQILEKVAELGFNIGHAYGMTEVLGIATVRPWKPEWDSSTIDESEKIRRREGLHSLFIKGVDVKDPNTMKSVPFDGKRIGEIMFKANGIMLGYLKNSEATQEVFRDGWYHTGDLAVRHPDGYIQIKDRKTDIIISGAETISSLEVEAVLLSNPKVSEAAVVGKPDDQLKQVPCAFVKLKEGCDSNPEELIKFCEDHLPGYMVPRSVIFEDIPVNSTGKVQKFTLREKLSQSH
ncbi:butanoate--CoA ligase AAE1-like [Mangifera indica]|uniref:butanoate--CoA ligase AAE1-like n=1 Tax=Mangifera indica TaxID=29780 RepID=UPI001CF9EBE1|nr:butanoate--CoA ligase AAE1-like [Mangifera indica]